MAQLLGAGLLLSAAGGADGPFEPVRDRAAARAVEALAGLLGQPS
jgi:hypothetical protein